MPRGIVPAVLALAMLASGAARASGYPDTSAFGGQIDTRAAWYRQCMRVRDAAPPPADMAAPAAQAPCDAQLLYYDTVDTPDAAAADWGRVRACAYARRDNAVLAMLYANGYGVTRSRDLALKYACAAGGAPLELAGRVERLARTEPAAAPAFDQCDDAVSRLMINTCAAIAARRNDHMYHARMAKLAGGWPAAQRAALAGLERPMRVFADARARYESDPTGSLGALYAPAAESMRAAEAGQFVSDLERWEQGRLPAYTAAQDAGFADQLALAYRKLMRAPAEVADGVRRTEQAWQAYRDAWVAFGHVRYPAVPPHAWRALLEKRRLEQLRKLHREISGKR